MSIKTLQDFTFTAKYSKYQPEKKRRETWKEAVQRSRQMMLDKYQEYGIDDEINWAYDLVEQKKVVGSQRTLQFAGTPIWKHHARGYNCSASYVDRLRFFQECMYLLLCGCGTGFSVQKHHVAKLPPLLKEKSGEKTFVIPDSIEGWSDAIGILVSSYFDGDIWTEYKGYHIRFDGSQIRPEGSKINSFNGKAPGPAKLLKALEHIRDLMDRCLEAQEFRTIDAYDVIMYSADAVVAGGSRRSATICLFSPDDEDMLSAKTGDWFYKNPQRGRSNNSVMLLRNKTTEKEFKDIVENTRSYGEPGFVFVSNLEEVFNPCLEIGQWCYNIKHPELFAKFKGDKIECQPEEIGLESGWQMCNLSSINCKKVKTEEDFYKAAKAAAIIGTLQAGFTRFPYLGEVTEKIVRRENLLGVSMTGIMESVDICLNQKNQQQAALVVRETNKEIASKINVNPAARATACKPEGCQNGSTIIITNEGILTLDELKPNYMKNGFNSHNLSVRSETTNEKSENFFYNGIANTKIIKTDGGITLEATLNHKFRVLDGENLIWKSSKDIVEGDIIPYLVGGYNGGKYQELVSIQSPSSRYATRTKIINQPNILDEDLAWFIGNYFGNGSNHKAGIRVYGNKLEKKGFDKIIEISKTKFNLQPLYFEHTDKKSNRCGLTISSKMILSFLNKNSLLKAKSDKINIPLIIRKSPKSVIESFVDGYANADGCDKGQTRSFCTVSTEMAKQLPIVLRAIGQDCKVREMPPTNSSWGKKMRYWIQIRKGRNGNIVKGRTVHSKFYPILDNLGLNEYSVDIVKSIQDGNCETYDVEVKSNQTYISNSYISHNTSSCILGTSSGIHPHHAKRYIRRVQTNKNCPVYGHFKKVNPKACEESVWSNNKSDDVISFCVEVPDGSKTKNQVSAIELLKCVQSTQTNWIKCGKNEELCTQPYLTHNVSNTIHVKPHEWEEVIKFIYDNRQDFCGVSLLSITGDKDYQQAPFTTIYLPSEISRHYGDGSILVSGLIERALELFDDNLWTACDTAIGLTKVNSRAKQEWCRKVTNFANKYMGGDIKKLTYCMKDVYNYKYWLDLNREYKDVDYETLIEEEDNTNLQGEMACSGGQCELI